MKRVILFSILLGVFAYANAQTRIVGHRGCRFNTPDAPDTDLYENTLNSIAFAQSLGIYAAEIDVQLTSDEKVIVFHGPGIPGGEKNIQKISFSEAREVVLPGGNRMPTLMECLSLVRKTPDFKLVVELKKQSNPKRETTMVEQTMSAVKKMGMENQVEYTTFSEWMCSEIHRVNPDAKVIYLDSGVFVKTPEYAFKKGYNGISYDFEGFFNHPDYIKRAKDLGIETTLWLVNHHEVIDWAIIRGVDFVSSDHPEKVKAYIDTINQY